MSSIKAALSEYDQCQYELMLDRLEAFQRSAISLGKLIGDLRSLVEVLKLPSPNWKERFIGEWMTLEEVYDVAIDRNELDRLPTESQELLASATASLREMVIGAMSSARETLDLG